MVIAGVGRITRVPGRWEIAEGPAVHSDSTGPSMNGWRVQSHDVEQPLQVFLALGEVTHLVLQHRALIKNAGVSG